MAECSQVNTGEEKPTVNMDLDDKQFTCHICMENYTNPRYLPTCGHTFCEHCLLAYSRNLQQQGSKLECPVCRKPQSFPENGEDVTLEWVQQTFPLNTAIIKMMNSLPVPVAADKNEEQMDQPRSMCEPCRKRDKDLEGLNFCLDCKEVLCETCTDYHKHFKVSEHHKLVPSNQHSFKASHEEFFKSFTKCETHPDKEVEFYCEAHGIAICSVCATTYYLKPCNTVELSSLDTDSEKFREKTEKLISGMKAAVEQLNILQKTKVDNKTSLREKMKAIRENIEQVRDQVVELMEKIVRHVSDVTKQLDLECENSLDKDIARMQKIKELAVEKLAALDTIEQHGTERHTFVSAHCMVRQFTQLEAQIEKEDICLTNIDAELKIADELIKLIECTEVEKLVDVTLNESKSYYKRLDEVKFVNQLKECQLIKVGKHNVRLIQGHLPMYSGVAMKRNGRIILIDNWKYENCGFLCVYNPRDKSKLKLKLDSPFSATQIDDTHIAVCIPDNNTVVVVTVGNELTVEKTFRSQKKPQSIVSLSNGDLAISWLEPPAFGIINISGPEIVEKSYLDRDASGRVFKSFARFAVDERRHRLIQSCMYERAVYCFDLTGDPLFTFKHSGLVQPRGVALDRCGNIYICELKSGSIYRLSTTGELINIFSKGVPSSPRAICSDGMGTGFWVTQFEEDGCEAVVYFQLDQNKHAQKL